MPNDESLFEEFKAWREAQQTGKADSTPGDPAGEAAFNSDTTERDKKRTDLPYAVQSDSEPVEGTNPDTSPITPTPVGHRPTVSSGSATGSVEDAIGRIESMVTDIHKVFSDAQPVVSEAANTLRSEGIGGVLKAFMGR